MARGNDGTTGRYFRTTTLPFTGYPWSIAFWGWLDDNTTDRNFVCVTADNTTDYVEIRARGSAANDPLTLNCRASNSADFLDISPGPASGAWFHVTAVGVSATDRRLYLNGGSKVTSTFSRTPASLAALVLGALKSTTYSNLLNGRMSDLAFWNIALTDADALQLARGYSPLLVEGSSLVQYYRLKGIANEVDEIGGVGLTMTGTMLKGAHPPNLRYQSSNMRRPFFVTNYTITKDAALPLASQLNIAQAKPLNFSFSGYAVRETSLSFDTRVNVQQSWNTPTGWLQLVTASYNLPLEYAGRQAFDFRLPFSSKATIAAARAVPISWNSPSFAVIDVNSYAVALAVGTYPHQFDNFLAESTLTVESSPFTSYGSTAFTHFGGPWAGFYDIPRDYPTLTLRLGDVLISGWTHYLGALVFPTWTPQAPITSEWYNATR